MFERFRKKYDLQAQEIMVVGDTLNDMLFAHRCHAKAAGVLSGLAAYEELEKEADIVLENVAGTGVNIVAAGNVDAVLDGGIDIFINAYLKWIALSKKPAEQ